MEAVRVPPSACSASQSTVICTSPSVTRSHTARSERAISRWISWVRPDCFPLAASREARSGVEPGSMEYSAVTQPAAGAPHPGRHPLLDRRGTQHLGLPERHEHRPRRHHRVVTVEADRPQLVDGAPVLARRAGISAHIFSLPLHSSRFRSSPGHRRHRRPLRFRGRPACPSDVDASRGGPASTWR